MPLWRREVLQVIWKHLEEVQLHHFLGLQVPQSPSLDYMIDYRDCPPAACKRGLLPSGKLLYVCSRMGEA